jgi:hypothetical protein
MSDYATYAFAAVTPMLTCFSLASAHFPLRHSRILTVPNSATPAMRCDSRRKHVMLHHSLVISTKEILQIWSKSVPRLRPDNGRVGCGTKRCIVVCSVILQDVQGRMTGQCTPVSERTVSEQMTRSAQFFGNRLAHTVQPKMNRLFQYGAKVVGHSCGDAPRH